MYKLQHKGTLTPCPKESPTYRQKLLVMNSSQLLLSANYYSGLSLLNGIHKEKQRTIYFKEK